MSDDTDDEDHVLTHPEHLGEPDPACSLCAVELPRRSRHGSMHERGGDTLQELADELGVSRERIRQIEKKAMAKALRACKRLGITIEDILGDGPHGRMYPPSAW